MNAVPLSTRPLSSPSRLEFSVCRQRLILIERARALRDLGGDKEPSPFPADETYQIPDWKVPAEHAEEPEDLTTKSTENTKVLPHGQ